ncbi:MAG: DUF1826 domain-containing protein [Bacteroidota bacterium]
MSFLNTVPFFKSKLKAPEQVIGSTWDHRSEILKPHVNLFCWQRPLDLEITHYLEDVLSTEPQAIRCSVDQETLHKELISARTSWDNKEKSEGDLFWLDVQQITRDFLRFSEDGTGILHLKVVANNACTKFHVDGYQLRLFSTYYGPGTEWLPEDAVNRRALGTTNECIIVGPNKIQQMKAGHVAILKGELPGKRNSVGGIVHRSPAITETHEKRIILRVDI